MKNKLRLLIALLLAASMIFCALPLSAGAADARREETRRTSGHITFRNPGSRTPAEEDGKKGEDGLPDYYNSTAQGLVTPIKTQGYGDCWAHAALASCETYMIKNGVNVSLDGQLTGPADATLDLAENHLCSFSYGNCVDPLGVATDESVNLTSSYGAYEIGGNGYIAGMTLMSINGPANEGTAALAYRGDLSPSFRYPGEYAYLYDAGYVTDVMIIPISDRIAMKRAILEYGAGSYSYCSAPNGSFTTYTNDDTGASCFIQDAEYGDYDYWYCDHDVTVVGWDDNYSRENFNAVCRPENDGAWIIKNSWGPWYGDDGYYYVSYEDTAANDDEAFFYKVEERDPDTNVYQYDNIIGFEYAWVTGGQPIANSFVAQRAELLDSVAIFLGDDDVDYTLEIYVGCDAGDPSSGTLALTQTGTVDKAGYRNIELDEAVRLSAGQRYSVVFTLGGGSRTSYCVYTAKSVNYSEWGMRMTHGVYPNSSFRSFPDGGWTDQSSKLNYRIKAYTRPVEEPDWYVDNYKFVVRNGSKINYMRIAPGVLTTSAEIRNHPDLISVDKALCDSYKNESGVLTYDFMKAGVYSIWIRYDGGDAYILSGVDITNITPSIGAINGITVTVDNLVLDDTTGVKDLWIARGNLDTFSQIKDAANKIVQATANKIAQANNNYGRSYTYEINYKAISQSGDYTVAVRYNDNRETTILHFHVDYPQPEIIVNGIQSKVTALAGVKCVRVAPGVWEDASQVKKAPGVRVFTAKTILKGLDEYTIQYREDGPYTLSIEYDGGYTVVETIQIAHLVPEVTLNSNNTVTLGDLDDLYIIRYAPNPKNSTDWSQGYFKQAPGNRYAKTANLVNGMFTTEVLPTLQYKDKNGNYTTCSIWTFMVQYTEESYSIFTVNFTTGTVTWIK